MKKFLLLICMFGAAFSSVGNIRAAEAGISDLDESMKKGIETGLARVNQFGANMKIMLLVEMFKNGDWVYTPPDSREPRILNDSVAKWQEMVQGDLNGGLAKAVVIIYEREDFLCLYVHDSKGNDSFFETVRPENAAAKLADFKPMPEKERHSPMTFTSPKPK